MTQLATLNNAANMLKVRNFSQLVDIFGGDNKKTRNFVGLVYACFQNEPKLLRCTENSVLTSVMQAAECDLVPGSAMQHCFLIPYGSTCQLQIGYRGLAEMVQREGAVKKVWAHVVYEDEVAEGRFKVYEGSRHELIHERDPFREDPPSWKELLEAGLCGAYACAELASGSVNFEVVGMDPLRRAKSMSRSDAWDKWATEMVRKFPLKRLCKRLPKTNHMERFWHVEEQLGKQDAVVLEQRGVKQPEDLEDTTVVIESRPDLDIYDKLRSAWGLLDEEQQERVALEGFCGCERDAHTPEQAGKWYMRIKEMLS